MDKTLIFQWICCLALICPADITRADIIVNVPDLDLSQNTPQSTIDRAVYLVKTGRLDDAKSWLSRTLAEATDIPHGDIIVARILVKLGRGADARRVLEALAVREPDRLDVRHVFCEMAVSESRWFDGLTHAQATEQATVPDRWSPRHIQVVRQQLLILKAACCEGCGDWTSARQIYLTTTRSDNQPASVFASLGRCHFRLGNYDDAATQFERAFKADNQQDIADLALARLFDAADQPKQAEQHFRAAIRHADSAARTKSLLAFGHWLLWNNEPVEIETLLEESLSDELLDKQRQFTLAMAHRMLGRFQPAQTILSLLHQFDPLDFAIGNQFALLLIELPDESLRGGALQIAVANVRNHGSSAEAWATPGWVQFRLGDVASARQNLSRGTSTGNVSRDTAWQLAQVYRQQGNTTEANELLTARTSF